MKSNNNFVKTGPQFKLHKAWEMFLMMHPFNTDERKPYTFGTTLSN